MRYEFSTSSYTRQVVVVVVEEKEKEEEEDFCIDHGPLRGSSSPLWRFDPAKVKPNEASVLAQVGPLAGSVNRKHL